MDPNAALVRIRVALQVMDETTDIHAYNSAAEELREHVTALDQWLSDGNFPPEDWVTRK